MAAKTRTIKRKDNNINAGRPAFDSANLIHAVLGELNVENKMGNQLSLAKLAEHKFFQLVDSLSFFFGYRSVEAELRKAIVEVVKQKGWERITAVTDTTVIPQTLYETIHKLRSKRMSQTDIAKTVGVSQSYVSAILNGRRTASRPAAYKRRSKN